jgi:alpha/beta superfamily hydrolase
MSEVIRPSTVLPSKREEFSFTTADGLTLIGEKAIPLGEISASILALHPNPSGGGMMDSHIYKKSANRLPAMAGVEIIRFNTRGTVSEQGKSEGKFDNGVLEKFDVLAALDYCFAQPEVKDLWVMGWSFGTDLALQYARDSRIKGLILLSPPLKTTTDSDLQFWKDDGRPITALVPEFDEYLSPAAAHERFDSIPNISQIDVIGGKHLWVGEPQVYRVLTEIVKVVAPKYLPLPTEY